MIDVARVVVCRVIVRRVVPRARLAVARDASVDLDARRVVVVVVADASSRAMASREASMMSTFESLVVAMMMTTPTPTPRVASTSDDDDTLSRRAVRRAVASCYELALGARERQITGRGESASTRRKTRATKNAPPTTVDAVYVRLCERDGDDVAARRFDALVCELRTSFGEDGDGFDALARALFALEGAGGARAARERRAATARARDAQRAFGGGGVDASVMEETSGRAAAAMGGTPDVGRLRARAGGDGLGEATRVPTLRLGAVFSARDEEEEEEEEEEDARVSDDRVSDDDAPTTSASAWLRAARDSTTSLMSWDARDASARDGASCLGAAAFDAAYRSTFTSARGIDGETVIASERDCAHVVAAALAGCRASADILVAAGSREGDVTMRFAAGSTTAFQNALKTMAVAAERRCELEHALEEMTTPYARPAARAARDVLRSHDAALYAITDAVAERRRDDGVVSTSVDVPDVTLLEMMAHTKRLRHQVDAMWHLLTTARADETRVVSHATLVRRLETALSHVEDEETPMMRYLYARAVKPVIDDALSWMYRAAPSGGSSSDFFVEHAPAWTSLETFDRYRGGDDVPCWLGGPVHDGEGDEAETDSLSMARARPNAAPALVAGSARDILRAGTQLRLLQRVPHTKAFARAVEDAFMKVSAFEACDEAGARRWLNRVRVLESRVVAAARESLRAMRDERAAHEAAARAAREGAEARSSAEFYAREKARLDRLESIDLAKRARRETQLEELDAREREREESRARRIADERAWLEEREEKQRAVERFKLEKKMEETRARLEREDAKVRWFGWQTSRLALAEKRRAFVRQLEASHEEEAVVALADAMRDGVRISKPTPLVVDAFASVPRNGDDEDEDEDGEDEDGDAPTAENGTRESDSWEASSSSEDFADAPEALAVESTPTSSAVSLRSAEDDEMETDRSDAARTLAPPPPPTTPTTIMEPATLDASIPREEEDTMRGHLSDAFGTPLPLLLAQEMREIVARQHATIGHYTVSVFLDHFALEKHLHAVLRFALGGEIGFAHALMKSLRDACVDTRARVTRASAPAMRAALDRAVDDARVRRDAFTSRLRLREREDSLTSFDAYNLDLANGVECEYASPWPINLVFTGVREKYALRHAQTALLQMCHATNAVKDVSALIHASARWRPLMDASRTSAIARERRARNLSLMAAAFRHFVDAASAHALEAIHIGAKEALFSALRADDGRILPRHVDDIRDVVETFCVRAHAACFLRPVDSALKALVDEGLQLALDFARALSDADVETLLDDGPTLTRAQSVHAKFHALMTQLCFRARVTSSDAASGLIQRVDFNEFYLSAAIDVEF